MRGWRLRGGWRRIIRRLRRGIVTSGEPWAANAKVCSLVTMAKVATHDLWVISDSDVRVTPDYLRRVVLPFADAEGGMCDLSLSWHDGWRAGSGRGWRRWG